MISASPSPSLSGCSSVASSLALQWRRWITTIIDLLLATLTATIIGGQANGWFARIGPWEEAGVAEQACGVRPLRAEFGRRGDPAAGATPTGARSLPAWNSILALIEAGVKAILGGMQVVRGEFVALRQGEMPTERGVDFGREWKEVMVAFSVYTTALMQKSGGEGAKGSEKFRAKTEGRAKGGIAEADSPPWSEASRPCSFTPAPMPPPRVAVGAVRRGVSWS